MRSRSPLRLSIGLVSLLLPAWCGGATYAAPTAGGAPHRAAKPAKCQGEARPLALRSAVEATMAGAATHCYTLDLEAGQFARLVAEQRGVDLKVTLFGPDGREIVNVDNQNATHGPEAVSLVADASGTYLLRVKKLIKNSVDGSYVVELREARAATAADREMVAADRALVEGQLLLEKRDAASLKRALEKFNYAARVFRTAGDTYHEAFTLYLTGVTLAADRKEESLRAFGQSIPLFAAAGAVPSEAAALQEMGEVYLSLGRNDEALESQEQALTLGRKGGNEAVVANALLALGSLNFSMGARKQGLRQFEESLRIWKKLKYPQKSAVTLMLIADFYLWEGNTRRALSLYNQAFFLFGDAKDSSGVAAAYSGMAWAYLYNGEEQQALQHFDMALALVKRRGDRGGEAAILGHLGWVFQRRGDSLRALDLLSKGLAICRDINDRKHEANILEAMMFASRSGRDPDRAILYGKQAINIYQDIRANSQSLEVGLQSSFVKGKENIYRTLADLLITRGRLLEAEQVLEMLKEDEYFKYLRRQSGGKAHSIRTSLTGKEKALEDSDESTVEIDKAIKELEAVETKTTEQHERLGRLREERRQAKKKMGNEMSEALGERAGTGGGPAGRPQPVVDAEPLDLGPGVVRINTLRGRNVYRVFLFTSGGEASGKSDINENELNQKILKFRQALQDPATTEQVFLPLAQDLYKIIVRPVEKALRDSKAKTLLWRLDGALRYLPVAALHDGKEYMAQRYRNVVLTPRTLPRMAGARRQPSLLALGLGVTKAYGSHPGLTAVGEELAGIIRDPGDLNAPGVLPGRVLLNDEFTEKAMLKSLAQKYMVIHIASHFEFQPSTGEKPYLLLGDGTHLTLNQIFSESPGLFQDVDLLTLSACNTATGDDSEGIALESFGARAQDEGAHTVMATLWSVADKSTSRFMREFYRLRNDDPEMSKAEALRLAQLSLLNGSATGASADRRGATPAGPGQGASADPRADGGRAPYSHPYFWAPFILIGDWR